MKRLGEAKLVLIVACVLCFCIIGSYVTNGILNQAYKPYKGVVVVLDAGHGGKDDGARYAKVKEQDLNLTIVYKLKKSLEDLGMKVILTRTDEKDLASEGSVNRKREDIKNRVKIINQKDVDFFISVHMNAYNDSSVKGSAIFYAKGSSDSHQFASDIQEEIIPLTNSRMEVKAGDYYILEKSYKMGILLECGFLSNPHERKKLSSESYQNKLVNSVTSGIINFFRKVYE